MKDLLYPNTFINWETLQNNLDIRITFTLYEGLKELYSVITSQTTQTIAITKKIKKTTLEDFCRQPKEQNTFTLFL